MNDLEPLTDGWLRSINFDPVALDLTLRVFQHTRETVTEITVVAKRVDQFRFHNDIPGPWWRAVIASARDERLSDEQHHVELQIWADACSLSFHCQQLHIHAEAEENDLALNVNDFESPVEPDAPGAANYHQYKLPPELSHVHDTSSLF